MEGPIAVDQAPVVHLDGEAGRAATDLRRVVEAQAPAVALGRRPIRDHGGDELVELWRWDPLRGALRELDRLAQDGRDTPPGERRAGQDGRAQAELLPGPSTSVVNVGA